MAKPESDTGDELRRRKDELELENLEYQVDQGRMKRQLAKQKHESNEQALKMQNRADRHNQRVCTHMKRGKADQHNQGFIRGGGDDGADYAKWVVKMPNGEIWITCSRCGAEWKPGDTAKNHPTGIAYETALKWPTTNTMAETCQFRIPERRAEDPQRELAAR